MTTRTPASKRASGARRHVPPRPRAGRRQRPPVLLLAVAGSLLVAGLVALILSGVEDDTSEPDESSVTPASVTGNALPALPEGGTDPAVGEPAPVVRGEGLNGEETAAPRSGQPTVLLFVAHWCPHCQAEVPEVQEWLDSDSLPDEVNLVAVSTAIDPARPNYPPSDWLDREGWSAPTVTDSTSAAAEAFGLTSFPYWVAVDADGAVVARHAGSLTTDQLDALVMVAQQGSEVSA